MKINDITLEELKKIAKYSTLMICKILGLNRERLRDWMEQKHIKPTLPIIKGHSSKAGFTLSDIFGIAIFKMLVEKGYKRDLVSKILAPHIGSPDSILDRCSYFLIMFSKDESGETVAQSTAFTGSSSDMQITFDSNRISFKGIGQETILDWDDIEIINLHKLREEVNQGRIEV